MITRVPIQASEAPQLAPLFAAYITEVAPGLPTPDLTRWWQEDTRHPYWLLHNNTICGFALCRALPDGTWELSEFCILPAARKHGLGMAAAQDILQSGPTRWQIGVVTQPPAPAFWAKVAALPFCKAERGPPETPYQSHSYLLTIHPQRPHP